MELVVKMIHLLLVIFSTSFVLSAYTPIVIDIVKSPQMKIFTEEEIANYDGSQVLLVAILLFTDIICSPRTLTPMLALLITTCTWRHDDVLFWSVYRPYWYIGQL